MNSLDFNVLHILALQYEGNLPPREIKSIAGEIDYANVDSFSMLKDAISEKGNYGAYPSEKSWNSALRVLEQSEKLSIKIYPINSVFYPKSLREIDDAPNLLHMRGNVSCINRLPGVAVVGSRKVTINGEKIARRISSYLASNGWTVVSGLALGVDAAAHRGALEISGEGNTIAVLAHGLEKAKPVRNAQLGEEILERGGLWVSEHAVGIPPRPNQFVARNRIQLGLSVGSVLIEAELKSGSMTQAKFCARQKRPLFAVVPQDDNNRLKLLCSGTESLVKESIATPIKSKDDYPKMLDRFTKQKMLMESL